MADEYLTTTPGTQLEFTGRWCMGHGRLPWWLHHIGHRLHLLRMKDGPKLRYIDE